ncbi:TPA: hypothetical protein ACXI1U_002028 [Serratia marcescens]
MPRSLIETAVNSKGVKYCWIKDGDTHEVWKLCENYNRHVRGGISKSWRYIQIGMTENEAKKLYKRRIK